MRNARNTEGNQLFTQDEFLNAQQIQSYFSWQAGKLCHQNAEEGNGSPKVAIDQQQYWDTLAEFLVKKFSSSILLLMTILIFPLLSCEQAEVAYCCCVNTFVNTSI